jgi:hypothetical protein
MDIRVLALLAIAAVATGCGNGEVGRPDGTAIDESATEQEAWDTDAYGGCDLVADEEIRAALGEAVVEKEEGGWYGCRWKTESFVVGLSAFADTSLPADSCAEGGESMPYGKSAMGRQEPVGGLGDEAIWGSSGDLLVCTARGLLTVDMERTPSTMSPPEEKEVAMLIARNALSRLERGSR